MGRRSLVAVAIGAALALAVGVLLYARSNDDTTPVSVDDALSDFRGKRADAEDRPRDSAEPGVYVYSTVGYELLGGTFSSRHDYPRTSTVTVSEMPCGRRERWDALAERHSTSETCIDDRSTRLRSISDYHEFFGQPREARFSCANRAVPRPERMSAGLAWSTRCKTPDGDAMTAASVVRGIGETDVAGRGVPSVHVRLVSTVDGGFRGRNVVDSWLRRSDGLLLARRLRADMSVDTPIGEAPYRERYELHLRSLDPRR